MTYHFTAPVNLDLYLQHIPIRSSDQILKKVLNGLYSFSLKENRAKGEGAHWDKMYKNLKSKNFKYSLEDIQDMALNYSAEEVKDTSKMDLQCELFLLTNIQITETKLKDLELSIILVGLGI